MAWSVGSPRSLTALVGEPADCPICGGEEQSPPCTHQFYGAPGMHRVGDPKADHPRNRGREIPCPRRIYSDSGQLLFAEGDLMTAAEAIEHGVPVPQPAAPGRRKGQRARRPGENREHVHGDNRDA